MSAERPRPGWLGPTQDPESLPLPQSTTNRPDSGKEKSTTITWYALFQKNFLLWTISNKYKENRIVYSKHLSLSLNNYQHFVYHLFLYSFLPQPSSHPFFSSFSGTVASLLTSKCTNLSCSTLTDENVCVTHTPRPSAHPYLPIKFPGTPSQAIPGPPHSPEARAFLICFLHRLVSPVWELHISGIT